MDWCAVHLPDRQILDGKHSVAENEPRLVLGQKDLVFFVLFPLPRYFGREGVGERTLHGLLGHGAGRGVRASRVSGGASRTGASPRWGGAGGGEGWGG